MHKQIVLRVGEHTFATKRAVLSKHPCSLLGRAFDSDSSSAGLRQNDAGEYELTATELGPELARAPAALLAALLGSYTSDVIIPVPGTTREQLLDSAARLGIDWARTAHDLVSSDAPSDVARGVRLFSVHVLAAHEHDADALYWAAVGLHRLGRNREAAVLLARLLDDQPANTAATTLALVVADARARSRRLGFVPSAVVGVCSSHRISHATPQLAQESDDRGGCGCCWSGRRACAGA